MKNKHGTADTYWTVDLEHRVGRGELTEVGRFDNYREALRAFGDCEPPDENHTVWLGRHMSNGDVVSLKCR